MASADILRAEHSPLPFEASRESIFSGETNIAICDVWDATSEIDDANAAFIVRACNAHYQMLEALKSARAQLLDLANDIPSAAWLTDELYADCSALAAIDAAIAAAEAEAGR